VRLERNAKAVPEIGKRGRDHKFTPRNSGNGMFSR